MDDGERTTDYGLPKTVYIVIICNVLLGFVIMLHSYYYISLFMPFINIPVSLDNLFQRIASIYGLSLIHI